MSETSSAGPPVMRNLYELVTGDEDARVCLDIPDAACREQPRNLLSHVVALSLTNIGDQLASAKTTLAWLMTVLGAPPILLSALVPIRESLSLLPQLAVARQIRQCPQRKWFWVVGSVLQGMSLGLMAVAALVLNSQLAAWTVIGGLVLFSLARGVCSVAAKDVMGKTVSKGRRGTVSGYASSIAGVATIALGAWLGLDGGSKDLSFLVVLLIVAGSLWLLAALSYAQLVELPGATEGGGNALEEALKSLRLAWSHAQLRDFLTTRMLLLASALAAPFVVDLAARGAASTASGLKTLGGLVAVSGLGSALSAAVWGRLADRSSRLVMAWAGVAAAAVCGALAALALMWEAAPQWAFIAGFFVLSTAHAGVRLGRKTYLVDMAGQENRATYVAVSNTIIGIVLLVVGGMAGALAQWQGSAWTLAVFAVLATGAVFSALRLPEA